MRRLRRGEHGSLCAEFIALVPILTVILAVAWQLLVTIAAGNSTAHAARNASRALSTDADVATTMEESLPGWLRDEASYEVAGDRVTVEVEVPLLSPSTGARPYSLSRSAELPTS